MDEKVKNTAGLGGVPVLTGEVAERFTEICENNARNLSGSQYSKLWEDWVKKIMEKRKVDPEEFQKQIDGCNISIEEILEEHLRTPYSHGRDADCDDNVENA